MCGHILFDANMAAWPGRSFIRHFLMLSYVLLRMFLTKYYMNFDAFKTNTS